MLREGYLSGVNLYASLAHTPEILDNYFESLSPIFKSLGSMDNLGLAKSLPSGPAQSGFIRLT